MVSTSATSERTAPRLWHLPQAYLTLLVAFATNLAVATYGVSRRSLLTGVSVTCHFDDEDAAAIAHELRGLPDPPASRADLRSFMRRAIRRALGEARERLEELIPSEKGPSPSQEGGIR